MVRLRSGPSSDSYSADTREKQKQRIIETLNNAVSLLTTFNAELNDQSLVSLIDHIVSAVRQPPLHGNESIATPPPSQPTPIGPETDQTDAAGALLSLSAQSRRVTTHAAHLNGRVNPTESEGTRSEPNDSDVEMSGIEGGEKGKETEQSVEDESVERTEDLDNERGERDQDESQEDNSDEDEGSLEDDDNEEDQEDQEDAGTHHLAEAAAQSRSAGTRQSRLSLKLTKPSTTTPLQGKKTLTPSKATTTTRSTTKRSLSPSIVKAPALKKRLITYNSKNGGRSFGYSGKNPPPRPAIKQRSKQDLFDVPHESPKKVVEQGRGRKRRSNATSNIQMETPQPAGFFSTEDNLLLQGTEGSIQLTNEQINAIMNLKPSAGCPITAVQLKHFDVLTTSLAPVAQIRGAVKVRANLSGSDLSKLESSRAKVPQICQSTMEISVPKKHLSWYQGTPNSKVQTVVLGDVVANQSLAASMSVSEFERQRLGKEQDTASYVRDVPVDPIARSTGFLFQTDGLEGNVLAELNPPINGMSSPYLYVGSRGSHFSLHIEDEDTWSVNYLHRGEKIWYVIPPTERDELESFFGWVSKVDPAWQQAPNCSQFVRHMDIFLPQSLLKARKIDYHIIHQKAGEAVIVSPGTFHQGFNSTDSVAEAVNFASKSWLPLDYAFCSRSCKRFQQDDRGWVPMNLSALRDYSSDFQVNGSEHIAYKDIFRVQGHIADQSLGERNKTQACIGGHFAQRIMHLIISIANTHSIKELCRSLSSCTFFQSSSAVTPSDTAATAEDLNLQFYTQFLQAKQDSFLSSLRMRLASCRLTRQINAACQTAEKLRSHHKGGPGLSKLDIITQTAENILKMMNPEYRSKLLFAFQTSGENDRATVIRHLREMMTLGGILEPLVDVLGEMCVLCISQEEFNLYQNLSPAHIRVLATMTGSLRPKLKSLLSEDFFHLIIGSVEDSQSHFSDKQHFNRLLQDVGILV